METEKLKPKQEAKQMNKIAPFLWFNNNAEEAVAFYCSFFPNSKSSLEKLIAGDVGPWKPGTVATIAFEIEGQELIAFNGGEQPNTQFNEAISLTVRCEDQAEIDRYWSALTADGGAEIACGWLKDKFGLRWQIVPRNISQLVSKPAAMQAMMGMKKLDIAALEAAGRS